MTWLWDTLQHSTRGSKAACSSQFFNKFQIRDRHIPEVSHLGRWLLHPVCTDGNTDFVPVLTRIHTPGSRMTQEGAVNISRGPFICQEGVKTNSIDVQRAAILKCIRDADVRCSLSRAWKRLVFAVEKQPVTKIRGDDEPEVEDGVRWRCY
ncbi:hypothetical protein EXIGLDRAFT_708998 [Exidia glandulosa HHB12029]|uniref:Uncharacterized protein n=1 Tax=Exidia glandulosa HHB12029 TaxID=1314781 RepID=A0A166N0A5_EXIGL|nr:hypothetical protein EXIGLDRAFT_708998 [Exidia glandulosa HHB12029]